MITFLVDDVSRWYDYLKNEGVEILREPEHREHIQIDSFFVADPGGYVLEIQQFLKPELTDIFHHDG